LSHVSEFWVWVGQLKELSGPFYEDCRGGFILFSPTSWQFKVFLGFWQHHSFSDSVITWFYTLYVFVSDSSLLRAPVIMDYGPTVLQYDFILNWLFASKMTLVPNKITFWNTRDYDFDISFWRDTIQPITVFHLNKIKWSSESIFPSWSLKCNCCLL
jgi:hypothetical protein